MSATVLREEPAYVLLADTGDPSTYGLPSEANSVADQIAIARIKARRFLASAGRESVASSERAIRELRQRARRAREERPMVWLGILAGSAFVLGITLRIWGSRRS